MTIPRLTEEGDGNDASGEVSSGNKPDASGSLSGGESGGDVPDGKLSGDGSGASGNPADQTGVAYTGGNSSSAVYVVTFKNGGKTIQTATIKAGDEIGTLPAVTKKNYRLKGWYTESSKGSKISEKTKVTGDAVYYAQWTKVKAPGKVENVKVKAQKKACKVTWKKVSGAEGYEIRYSLKSNMKSAKKLDAGSQKTSAVIKKLKANKRYYVQVYAYKTDSAGRKLYSKTSAKKKVKPLNSATAP